MKSPPKSILTGLVALLALPLAAQRHEVVSAAGDSFKQDAGSLIFTVGEVAIETTTTLPHYLTQGFHQPVLRVQATLDDSDTGIPLIVFPNPVNTLLYLRNDTRTAHLRYTVLDARGIPVREGPMTDLTEISFEDLPGASYLLQVKRHQALIRHFKIIKQ
ncbi:T9SS type A sorting domain-containing protein [Fulvivirgaceae bacterium PWU5]|uniref:T9SS type A sorting domain-containing protein n=1 Tax=Dawidia cretensis TaxID=2782350 RepID=A0AAP2DX18_9BACT|nr:T9SS type A sorting domain-containing protein [Dawidia cretensis]MBT1708876.1 T9SS type A sorting domain-containing protein [Dawidia cretensis]